MEYFAAGLWHCAAALAFSAAFGVLGKNDAVWWLMKAEFTIPLFISACAFFFVPDAWAKKGLLKFLHYPLPDWDVLLFSFASHRHWLTHSSWLPVALWWASEYQPNLWREIAQLDAIAAGLCVGLGSHLFWDCVGSRSHKIVFVPHWWHLRSAASRLWLLGHAGVCLLAGVKFTGLDRVLASRLGW